MIAAWMIYMVAVSVLVALAASLSQRFAEERRWPTRWPWAGALAASALLPAWAAFGPRELGSLPVTAVLVLEPLRVTGASVAEWSWDPLLVGYGPLPR
jgi:hypothetical protein